MAEDSGYTRQNASEKSSRKRNPPRGRPRTTNRRASGVKKRRQPRNGKSLSERLDRERKAKAPRKARAAYQRLRRGVLQLVTEPEAERLARQTGFYRRAPKEIRAFEFALCCVLASVLEQKRGFASVWRVLAAAAGIAKILFFIFNLLD